MPAQETAAPSDESRFQLPLKSQSRKSRNLDRESHVERTNFQSASSLSEPHSPCVKKRRGSAKSAAAQWLKLRASEGEPSRQLNLAVAVHLSPFNLPEVVPVTRRSKVPVGARIWVGEFCRI